MGNNDSNSHLILLTNTFPYGVSENYLVNEIPVMLTQFNNIYIFTLNAKGPLNFKLPQHIKFFDLQGLPKEKISILDLLRIFIKELPLILSLPNKIFHLRYYLSHLVNMQIHSRKILKIVGTKYPSNFFLYTYWFNDLAIIASFIKKENPNFRFISRAHGYDVFPDQSKNNYIPFRNFQLSNVDVIASVSKAGESYLKKNFQIYSSKIITSYLGSKQHYYKNPFNQEQFSIITCSNIRAIKRLSLLVEILKHINFNVTWYVIGDGNDLENLKKECLKLSKCITVQFQGYFSTEQLYHFYRTVPVNLFCSLSSSEGLPVSMMEAISFGVPLMSTDVGGCKEICNEHTGFLIPKDFDPVTIAGRITSFRSSNKNSTEFRANVKKYWAENFCSEKNYQKFYALFKDGKK